MISTDYSKQRRLGAATFIGSIVGEFSIAIPLDSLYDGNLFITTAIAGAATYIGSYLREIRDKTRPSSSKLEHNVNELSD